MSKSNGKTYQTGIMLSIVGTLSIVTILVFALSKPSTLNSQQSIIDNKEQQKSESIVLDIPQMAGFQPTMFDCNPKLEQPKNKMVTEYSTEHYKVNYKSPLRKDGPTSELTEVIPLADRALLHPLAGAIIGDSIGANYEFKEYNTHDINFSLYNNGKAGDRTGITDDSTLTIATAQALMQMIKTGIKFVQTNAIQIYQHFSHFLVQFVNMAEDKIGVMMRFKNRGWFGGNFYNIFIKNKGHRQHDSIGNGSGMRCSSIAYMCDSIEQCEMMSWLSAAPSHNAPEGIKGAQAISTFIFMVLHGYSRAQIVTYLQNRYGYNLDPNRIKQYKLIKDNGYQDETCPPTVPVSIIIATYAPDFETALRWAVSVGGDSDTIADMVCAMVYPYFWSCDPGIKPIQEEVEKRLQQQYPFFHEPYVACNNFMVKNAPKINGDILDIALTKVKHQI
ncbi:hypothetical protein FACS189465_1800 [Clostridia bacterium]|nr:hypothetical protein FACS189465_1800 [Clostridia bacterium]